MESSICPSGWTYYSGKCYWVSTSTKNYANAKSDCKLYNATLAIPNNANEYSFLNSTISLEEEYYVNLIIFDKTSIITCTSN